MVSNGKRWQEERSRKAEVAGGGAWSENLAGVVDSRIGYT